MIYLALVILNEGTNILRFSHSKSVLKQSKLCRLQATSEISVESGTVQEKTKNTSYKPSQVSRAVAQHWEMGKVCDDAG